MSLTFLIAVAFNLSGLLLLNAMGVNIKYLREAGYIAFFLVMARNLCAFGVSLPILAASKDWRDKGRPLKFRQWHLIVARAVFTSGAQVCLYLAFAYVPLATAATMMSLSPVAILLVSILILGERIGFYRWAAVGLGFVGVLLVLQPWQADFTPWAILPGLAAFGYSTSFVIAKYIDKSVPSALINSYTQLGLLIISLITVTVLGAWEHIQEPWHWAMFGLIGLCGGIGNYCLVMASRTDEPINLAPFQYFELLFALILGWIFFREWPVDQIAPGAVLLVASGLIIVWRQRVAALT